MNNDTPQLSHEQPPDPTVTHTGYPDFIAAVKARVAEVFANEQLDLDANYIDKFSTSFAVFMDSIIHKYANGQREHGGSILDRDLMAEMGHEIRDLVVYWIVERLVRDPRAEVYFT